MSKRRNGPETQAEDINIELMGLLESVKALIEDIQRLAQRLPELGDRQK